MSDEELRIAELETEVRVLNRTITGMRNYIRIASEYRAKVPMDGIPGSSLLRDQQIEYLTRTLDGVQAALSEAAKYEARTIKGRKRRER